MVIPLKIKHRVPKEIDIFNPHPRINSEREVVRGIERERNIGVTETCIGCLLSMSPPGITSAAQVGANPPPFGV